MKCCSGTLLAIFVALSLHGCVAEEKGQTTTPLGAPYVLGDTSYPAYWLEKKTFGQWERVALVFGYIDDKDVCEEWAAWRRSKYYLDEHRCSELVGSVLYSPDAAPGKKSN